MGVGTLGIVAARDAFVSKWEGTGIGMRAQGQGSDTGGIRGEMRAEYAQFSVGLVSSPYSISPSAVAFHTARPPPDFPLPDLGNPSELKVDSGPASRLIPAVEPGP